VRKEPIPVSLIVGFLWRGEGDRTGSVTDESGVSGIWNSQGHEGSLAEVAGDLPMAAMVSLSSGGN